MNFKAPGKYKDAEHPSFWECRLKPNPHYVGAADEVCVVMSGCCRIIIIIIFLLPFLLVLPVNILFGAFTVLFNTNPTPQFLDDP